MILSDLELINNDNIHIEANNNPHTANTAILSNTERFSAIGQSIGTRRRI